LVYADDAAEQSRAEAYCRQSAGTVNLLGDYIDTIKKNTQILIDTSKKVGLEVNTEKLSICCCLVTKMQGKIMT
jgi:hypothetical protein